MASPVPVPLERSKNWIFGAYRSRGLENKCFEIQTYDNNCFEIHMLDTTVQLLHPGFTKETKKKKELIYINLKVFNYYLIIYSITMKG